MTRDSKPLDRFKKELEANRLDVAKRRELIRSKSGRPVTKARSRWLRRAANLRLASRGV